MSARELPRRGFLAGRLAVTATALAPVRAARAGASDLDFASALDAGRAIRSGQVSSVELTTRVLDRIQQHNGKLNAIVALAPDAVDRARAADETRARRDLAGPFHGVPCTIKETFEVAGVTTTAGSPALRSHVPARDAAAVARLRAAGIVLGKTNVPMSRPTGRATTRSTARPATRGTLRARPAARRAAGPPRSRRGSRTSARQRPRRLDPHPRALLRRLWPQAVPRCGADARAHPAAARHLGGAALDAAGGRPARALRGRPACRPRGAGRARRRRGAGVRWSLPPARGTRLADYRIGYVLDDPRAPVAPEVGDALAAAIEALRRAGARLTEGWPPASTPRSSSTPITRC